MKILIINFYITIGAPLFRNDNSVAKFSQFRRIAHHIFIFATGSRKLDPQSPTQAPIFSGSCYFRLEDDIGGKHVGLRGFRVPTLYQDPDERWLSQFKTPL